MQYIPATKVATVHQSDLNGARELKARLWKEVKRLRLAIEAEPLGGNRAGLRLQLLRTKSAHSDAQFSERQALRAIEVRANELRFTTIR